MAPPVSIVFDMEYEDDLDRLPEHLRLATTLAPSIPTLYASAYSDNDGSWTLDSVGAVTQYLELPLSDLRALRVDIGYTESLQEGVLADMLRPGWSHLRRLTLRLLQTPALTVEDLLIALHGTPRVTDLSLDCADWLDSSPIVENLYAPPLSLEYLSTENIFPGFDVLIQSSLDTLRTLVIGDPTLSSVNNYFHGEGVPTRLPRLRTLVIEQLSVGDIFSITSACPRLANFHVIHGPASAKGTEDTLVPALRALESPLKHLLLPHQVVRWQDRLPRLMDLFEQSDSPLRALRSLSFCDDTHRLNRNVLAASPLSQHLTALRIQQRIVTSQESGFLLPEEGF